MDQNILKKNQPPVLVALYLLCYLPLSARFLSLFPFVHSDEAWLAGLTRDMMEQHSFGVTESFFDLKPRVPHAIKLLFHWLQMNFISVFGYRVESVRLLSLTGAAVCLVFIYLIGKKLGGPWFALGLTVIVSLDIQFIYASHFARQEILLCVSLLACLLILLDCSGQPTLWQAALLGIITGLSIGLHPSSFLCAAVCGASVGIRLIADKGRGWKSFVLYLCVTGAFAALFIGISYRFDPHFLSDYFRYGEEEFELNRTLSGRIGEFFMFFQSVHLQESGTYYLPDLRLEMAGMVLASVFLLPCFMILRKTTDEKERMWRQNTELLFCALSGLAAGMVVIGRYNQLSIIFFLLIGWLMAAQFLLLFESAGRTTIFLILFFAMALGNGTQIKENVSSPPYDSYLEQIQALIPADSRTIGNLNMGFYFDSGMLRDYRNLPYLIDGNRQKEASLEQYIRDNQIRYICYSDELDFLYDHRPYYNVIYGNAVFAKELKDYCLNHCDLAGTIENPMYAARVISLLGDSDYINIPNYKTIKVYKVRDTP